MINLDDCELLGVVSKPHGIRGQLVVQLDYLNFDNIQRMEWVYVIIDGLPVPFFIESFSERNDSSIICQLELIKSPEEAKKLAGYQVYTNKKIVSDSDNLHNELNAIIGYSVVDKNEGEIGDLASIIDLNDNPLLQIIRNKQEILIPLHHDFIETIDQHNRILHVNCPPGLLTIND